MATIFKELGSNKLANFAGVKPGLKAFRPLKHKKTGKPLTDVEYFDLLGRKCESMDKANKTNIATDYGPYPREVCELAKTVSKALREGSTSAEVQQYLNRCIDYSH